MLKKSLVGGVLSLGVVLGPVQPVFAGGGDVVGGIIGGIIGGAIVNEASRKKKPVARSSGSSVSSYQREQNREVQSALNHFGYPAGTPDGVMGSRSRSAISSYQAFMGYPATGQLTEIERQVLVGAYQRAQLGGPAVTQVVSTHPQGMRGLLLKQRDEMAGGGGGAPGYGGGTYAAAGYGGLPPEVSQAVDEIARNSNVEAMQLIQRAGFIQLADMNMDGRTDYLVDTSVTGSGFWCNGPACTVRVFASTPQGYQRNDFQIAGASPASFSCQHGLCQIAAPGAGTAMPAAPVPAMPSLPPATMAAAPQPPAMPGFGAQLAAATPPAAAPAMPSFGAAIVPAQLTLSAHCSAVSAKTGSLGGVQTVAALSDPGQALGEQFCAVRTAAMTEGETLLAQIQGFSPEQIAAQCEGFGALLADQLAMLPGTARDDMIAATQEFVAGSGMDEAQAAGTAKVCLSVGLRDDQMPVALGSALVLAGTGNMVYAELVGHHLAAGIGTEKRPELALEWFDLAANARSVGQGPDFAPDQPDRMQLIHQAALAMAGRAEAPAAVARPVPVAATASALASGLAGLGKAAAGKMGAQ